MIITFQQTSFIIDNVSMLCVSKIPIKKITYSSETKWDG